MDPQLKSVLTSIGLAGATAVASWAVTKGYITPDQQSGLVTGLLTIAGALVAAGIAWYKTHQVSQKAMIQAVNTADNGVKVVPAAAPVAAVNEPQPAPAK